MSTGQKGALRWVALVILLAGGFMPPLDFFIVNVALSSIHESLGATPAELQLVISGYACGYGVFLITGGRLGDLYGRKRCFLIGMAGFSLASLGCGVATSPANLVIARIIQGSAAAAAAAAGARARSGRCSRMSVNWRRAMSAYGIMMGMAAAIGQFSGGALIQWNPADLGWRAIFLLTLPVCAVTLVLGWKVVPETGGGSNVRLDLGGAALISLALASIVVPLSEGREQGWPVWVFAVLACAPFLVGGFFATRHALSRAGGMPLVDMRLAAHSKLPPRPAGGGAVLLHHQLLPAVRACTSRRGAAWRRWRSGLSIVPYGVGLFIGPLVSAPTGQPAAEIAVDRHGHPGHLLHAGRFAGCFGDRRARRCRPRCSWPGSGRAWRSRGCSRRCLAMCRRRRRELRPASPTPPCRSARRSALPPSGRCSSWCWMARTGERAYAHAFPSRSGRRPPGCSWRC